MGGDYLTIKVTDEWRYYFAAVDVAAFSQFFWSMGKNSAPFYLKIALNYFAITLQPLNHSQEYVSKSVKYYLNYRVLEMAELLIVPCICAKKCNYTWNHKSLYKSISIGQWSMYMMIAVG